MGDVIGRRDIKGVVIAGTKSGSGKTTVALGLMASLVRRGFKVAPFKVGPDFIDPGFHTKITGIVSRNLDGWMLSKEYNLGLFTRTSSGICADLAVIEGVMGLFDGFDGKSEAGSTAQMAKWTRLPVVLVVDAKSMARSAAALVSGFERFDRDLTFAGVVFNNIGSKRHLSYLKEAMENNVNMPCLGGIPRDQEVAIPERHLGLFTSLDHRLSNKDISLLADLVEKNLDLDALLNFLSDKDYADNTYSSKIYSRPDPLVRIGVAYDNAFCFYYQDNLDILKSFGAELVYFSPINDKTLPDDIDGIYFGGGYPELFAERLSENRSMLIKIREKSYDGMPIYGECGGFMYLCREIIRKDNESFKMTGCFPFTTRMLNRLMSLGYREITLIKDTIIGRSGDTIRGHEFHYSKICSSNVIENVYGVTDRAGFKKTNEGFQTERTLGSYIHLHFGSFPNAAKRLVESCLAYKSGK